MKVEIQDLKEFTPVTITITFESDKEVCNMWHRMNATGTNINRSINDLLKYKASDDIDLWSKVDDIVIARNLYK